MSLALSATNLTNSPPLAPLSNNGNGSGAATPTAGQSPSLSPRKQHAELEIAKLWELFTKIRGSVSCKLVEAIVVSASQENNATMTAATLPPMAADLDWHSFKEYLSRWLKKNEERHASGSDVTFAAFRRARQRFAIHVRWEYEYQKKKFIPFDDPVSTDLERRFVEGIGECVFDANGEVFEVDLDSLIMYSEKAEYKLRRKVTVLRAADGEALEGDSHTVVRDMPSSNTAAAWAYRPLAAVDAASSAAALALAAAADGGYGGASASASAALAGGWQHFNRYQAFALERAFREQALPDAFTISIGGEPHTIVTVETVDAETGRHRGPHIRLASEPPHTTRYSLIRRVLVPREHCHASDVCWRLECPLVYAALAMRETRPAFQRAFQELERSGEIVLRPESLDDGDDEVYAVLRELVDRWGVAPTAFVVPGDLLRYEVLLEGTWVPMVPMNNWLMQSGTRVTNPLPSAAGPSASPSAAGAGAQTSTASVTKMSSAVASTLAKRFPPYIFNPSATEFAPNVRSIEHVVYLFKQWVPFDERTMTICLPSSSTEGSRVLWCRVAEEHESVVRFLLRDNEPWLCGREVLHGSSMFPRKYLEANHIVCCPAHTAHDCQKVMQWAEVGFPRERRPEDCQRAAEFLGFDKQWSGATR